MTFRGPIILTDKTERTIPLRKDKDKNFLKI